MRRHTHIYIMSWAPVFTLLAVVICDSNPRVVNGKNCTRSCWDRAAATNPFTFLDIHHLNHWTPPASFGIGPTTLGLVNCSNSFYARPRHRTRRRPGSCLPCMFPEPPLLSYSVREAERGVYNVVFAPESSQYHEGKHIIPRNIKGD